MPSPRRSISKQDRGHMPLRLVCAQPGRLSSCSTVSHTADLSITRKNILQQAMLCVGGWRERLCHVIVHAEVADHLPTEGPRLNRAVPMDMPVRDDDFENT